MVNRLADLAGRAVKAPDAVAVCIAVLQVYTAEPQAAWRAAEPAVAVTAGAAVVVEAVAEEEAAMESPCSE